MAKASKHVQPYSPEFRAEAIRLARTSGKSHRQIAEDLGMTSETLRLWLKQADLDAGTRQDGLSSEDQEELRRLRREVRILREEREILRKAAAHLPLGRPTLWDHWASHNCCAVRPMRPHPLGQQLPRLSLQRRRKQLPDEAKKGAISWIQ